MTKSLPNVGIDQLSECAAGALKFIAVIHRTSQYFASHTVKRKIVTVGFKVQREPNRNWMRLVERAWL